MARSGRRKKVPAFKKGSRGPSHMRRAPAAFSEKGGYADSMVSHPAVETGVGSRAE